jgi:hypothetical protein
MLEAKINNELDVEFVSSLVAKTRRQDMSFVFVIDLYPFLMLSFTYNLFPVGDVLILHNLLNLKWSV